ncbi:RNA polymerase sigma factor [Streptomyces krungchingensis]|uniref:RNA polymerase sigma factor n=1 Tax=Streptomyces sp. Tue6028 TaxID=2036037 RepID=UPI003D7643D4
MDLKTPDDDAGSPADSWAAQSSFTEFYGAEVRRIVLFVYKNGATWEDAWDATQSAFAEAFQRWDSINYPTKYVRRTALRHYQAHRQRSDEDVRRAAEAPWSYCPAFDQLKLLDEEKEVIDAIAQLPERQREVMAWHYDDFSVPEISELLSIDARCVRSNLHLARKKLKEALRDNCGWFMGGDK